MLWSCCISSRPSSQQTHHLPCQANALPKPLSFSYPFLPGASTGVGSMSFGLCLSVEMKDELLEGAMLPHSSPHLVGWKCGTPWGATPGLWGIWGQSCWLSSVLSLPPTTLGACAAPGLSPVGMVNSKKGGGGHLPIPNTVLQPCPRRKYSKSVVRARGNEVSTGGR